MCDSVASEDPLTLVYCVDRYKTQELSDDCLAALKFIPNWFATSKILKKFHNALLTNADIIFSIEYFYKV